jgi:hypothetical protein
MIKLGKRKPKNKNKNKTEEELDQLRSELGKLGSLDLERMIQECTQVFESFGFGQETYPELYSTLQNAGKARLDFILNLDDNLESVKEKAEKTCLVEDFYVVNPSKMMDGKHDVRMIEYFGAMISLVHEKAIKQYGPMLQEKWMNITRCRAEEGLLTREVDHALEMARQYANLNNTPLDVSFHSEIESLHKKNLEEKASKNFNRIAEYASRILKRRIHGKRFERLMHYAKKLSEESQTPFWHSDSALPSLKDEFPELFKTEAYEKKPELPGKESK